VSAQGRDVRAFLDAFQDHAEPPRAAAPGISMPVLECTWSRPIDRRLNLCSVTVIPEWARILSASGLQARAFLDAMTDSLNRRAILAPLIDRYSDPVAMAGLATAGRYLKNRTSAQPQKSHR
jgi:hypothetical protein